MSVRMVSTLQKAFRGIDIERLELLRNLVWKIFQRKTNVSNTESAIYTMSYVGPNFGRFPFEDFIWVKVERAEHITPK